MGLKLVDVLDDDVSCLWKPERDDNKGRLRDLRRLVADEGCAG